MPIPRFIHGTRTSWTTNESKECLPAVNQTIRHQPSMQPDHQPDPDTDDDRHRTIREMCDEFDVTPRTLRFYEARNLLSPARQGQHRLYGRRERVRLNLILQAKRFGFSLEQIGELLELYDPSSDNRKQIAATLTAARQRLAEMRHQKAELAEAITELASKIAAAEACNPALRMAAPDSGQTRPS